VPASLNPDGDTAVITVVPTTGPQDSETVDLVTTLRDDVLPRATEGSGVSVHVGGVTAASIDSSDNIAKRLPLLIGGVVLLSMLLLIVSFRSLAVAVKAALMNLLSVAAAYGVVALVLQGGWAGQLIGIDTPTPLPAFVPVLMFAVLFGLSMDYEVFLMSHVREAWQRTRDNRAAVIEGIGTTGRVITSAALIMVSVFFAFILNGDPTVKQFGVGMGVAVAVDATLVRCLLVPAVMVLLGRANWWFPKWLDRLMPNFSIEGDEWFRERDEKAAAERAAAAPPPEPEPEPVA
jgi:RND superfamily putative drug exporter